MQIVFAAAAGLSTDCSAGKAIFAFTAILIFIVFAWRTGGFAGDLSLASGGGGGLAAPLRAHLAALAASPRFFGYRSAPAWIGAVLHVPRRRAARVVTLLGRTSASTACGSFRPSIVFMAAIRGGRGCRHNSASFN